jgi:DNA-binding transcriptional ArsR family regulator
MAARQSTARKRDQNPARTAARPASSHAPRPSALDRLIHDRTRLAIVSALAANATLSFTELKALIGLSDGNLSVHARKLEDAGYVTCLKAFEGRMPKTEFKLTDAGHRALRQYLDHMEAIIRHARSKTRA